MPPSVIYAVPCPRAAAIGFRAVSPTALPRPCPLCPESVRSGVRRAWTLESGRHGFQCHFVHRLGELCARA